MTKTRITLQNSAQKVQDFLNSNGYDCTVFELPGSTRTAQEAAEAIGCLVAQIAKSLVFKNRANGEPVLVIASGANRVDIKKIKQSIGLRLGKADGIFVKERTGFAIGGIPPVCHTTSLQTILDPDLKNHEAIWAAAGTPRSLFKLNPLDLEAMTGGIWLDIAE